MALMGFNRKRNISMGCDDSDKQTSRSWSYPMIKSPLPDELPGVDEKLEDRTYQKRLLSYILCVVKV